MQPWMPQTWTLPRRWQLTEKEQKVILLYYYEDLTLKEIARVLEVSESRVSQLHTRALMKLKKTMGPYYGLMQE